jgi:hypothetical protein
MFDITGYSEEINRSLEDNKARHLASRQKRRAAVNSKITPEEKELLLNMYKELTKKEEFKTPEEEKKLRAKVLDKIAKDFVSLYTTLKEERTFSVAEFDILLMYLLPPDPRIKLKEDEHFDALHSINKHFVLNSINYDKGSNNPNKPLFKYTGKKGKVVRNGK